MIASDIVTIKASGPSTSDRFVLIEVHVRSGEGPPAMHRHYYSEAFYVLSGEFEFISTDSAGEITRHSVTEGDTIALPSMAWHNFKNVGSNTGRLLSFHSPSGMEHFAREFGVPIEDPQNPPVTAPLSDDQRQKLIASIGKYVEFMPMDDAAR